MAPVPSKLPVRPGFNRKRRSKSSRAGLVFPVSRFRRALKAKTTSRQRVGELASVYAASVMEYLTAEVLDICGQTAKQLHQKRLTPRHVRMTINGDLDFDELLHNVCIPGAGVGFVRIHPALLKKGVPSQTRSKPRKRSRVFNSGGLRPAPVPSIDSNWTRADMTPLPSSLPQGSDLSSSTSFGVLSERVLPTGVKISVVRSDIAKVEADALVNPSSGNFSLAGGIGSHLRLIGGKVFEREVTRARQSHGDIPVNGAALSKGYNFASPFVIHVYSPHFDPSSQAVSITDLRLTIRNLLDLACDNHFATIAVPSIGSGVNGFPKETAASNILNEMALYFDAKGGSSSVRQVYFVLFDQESITVYLHEIAKLVGTDPNATDASKNISSSTSATSKTTSVTSKATSATSKTTSVTPKAKTKGRGKRAKIA